MPEFNIVNDNEVRSESTSVTPPISTFDTSQPFEPVDNSALLEMVSEDRNAEPEVQATDYEVKSPINLNDVQGTQRFLSNEGYDLGAYGVDGVRGNKTNKAIQSYLVDQGYDIGQSELKNPIDGLVGRRTKRAIGELQNDIENPRFQKTDVGKTGFIGECSEDQCSATVQKELSTATGIKQSELYNKYGVRGDAWEMKDNIINSGGSIIYDEDTPIQNVKAGDIAQMYTGGDSNYQDEAGEGNPTHVGIIEDGIKYGSDGRPYSYIKHNVHRKKLTGGYQGRLYRDKIYLDDMSISNKDGKFKSFQIKSIARPKIMEDERRKNAVGNPNVQIVPKSNVPEVAMNGAIELNNVNNKTNVMRDFGLSESEYNSVALAALGIMGQESGYGEVGKIPGLSNKAELFAKESIASVRVNAEASRGYSRIKFDTNFGNNLDDVRRKYGITESSLSSAIDNGSKSALAAALILGKNYSNIKKSNPDMTDDDILYLAIQKHNRHNLKKEYGVDEKSSVEYAKDRDILYVNKVLMYANQFKSQENNNKVGTIVDRLNKDPKIINSQLIPMLDNNIINQDAFVKALLAEYNKPKN